MEKFKNTIVIGISSGIAAYKVIDLIKLLQERGFDLEVIMTASAPSILPVGEVEKVLGKKVYTELFNKGFDYRDVLTKKKVEHIELAKKASLIVIAPATANSIAKLAQGIADNFLTTTVLATTAPVVVCPSMNTNMWRHPAVVKNMAQIKSYGYHIIPPDTGWLACGTPGVGRLAQTDKIAGEIERILSARNRLRGKRIMVTAGGTMEPIDAVRVITNRSSGKMGLSIAEACFEQGAEVLLLKARNAAGSNLPIKTEVFETAVQLSDLIRKNIGDYDAIFHTAAVSDYTLSKTISGKADSLQPLTLHLEPAVKIIRSIKKMNPKIKLVGFKAVYRQTEAKIERIAMEKLKETQADYIIANDVGVDGIGFAADDNEVYIFSSHGLVKKIAKAPKTDIAWSILDTIRL